MSVIGEGELLTPHKKIKSRKKWLLLTCIFWGAC